MEAVEAVEAVEVNGVTEIRKSLPAIVWSNVLLFWGQRDMFRLFCFFLFFVWKGLKIDTFQSEAAEATWGIFFSIFFSPDQKSALQDHPKNNYLILNSKFKPHKLFKVSSFAFVHPVDKYVCKKLKCVHI